MVLSHREHSTGSSDPMARGALAKEQAVQQQSGAPVKKKRPMNLALLIEAGLVRDGGVLRYMKVPPLIPSHPLYHLLCTGSPRMLHACNLHASSHVCPAMMLP